MVKKTVLLGTIAMRTRSGSFAASVRQSQAGNCAQQRMRPQSGRRRPHRGLNPTISLAFIYPSGVHF
jgi:hypothetical protein